MKKGKEGWQGEKKGKERRKERREGIREGGMREEEKEQRRFGDTKMLKWYLGLWNEPLIFAGPQPTSFIYL